MERAQLAACPDLFPEADAIGAAARDLVAHDVFGEGEEAGAADVAERLDPARKAIREGDFGPEFRFGNSRRDRSVALGQGGGPVEIGSQRQFRAVQYRGKLPLDLGGFLLEGEFVRSGFHVGQNAVIRIRFAKMYRIAG